MTKADDSDLVTSMVAKCTEGFDVNDAMLSRYATSTSHRNWSIERAGQTCWKLAEIEPTFRVSKSQLGFRSSDRHIETDLLLSVLTYRAVYLIRYQFEERISWSTPRELLSTDATSQRNRPSAMVQC